MDNTHFPLPPVHCPQHNHHSLDRILVIVMLLDNSIPTACSRSSSVGLSFRPAVFFPQPFQNPWYLISNFGCTHLLPLEIHQVKLPSGAHSCPIGSEIISFEECRSDQGLLKSGWWMGHAFFLQISNFEQN